jgi:hypothetical protein
MRRLLRDLPFEQCYLSGQQDSEGEPSKGQHNDGLFEIGLPQAARQQRHSVYKVELIC